MFEFVIKEKLQSNKDLIKALDNIKYKTKLGCIKIISNTNLQVVEPTEYKLFQLVKKQKICLTI